MAHLGVTTPWGGGARLRARLELRPGNAFFDEHLRFGSLQCPSIGGVAHVGESGCLGDSGRAAPTHGPPPTWGWDERLSGAATGAMAVGLPSPEQLKNFY